MHVIKSSLISLSHCSEIVCALMIADSANIQARKPQGGNHKSHTPQPQAIMIVTVIMQTTPLEPIIYKLLCEREPKGIRKRGILYGVVTVQAGIFHMPGNDSARCFPIKKSSVQTDVLPVLRVMPQYSMQTR